MTQNAAPLPADDLNRQLAVTRLEDDQHLTHLAVVGDTYTILLSGQDVRREVHPDGHADSLGGKRPTPHRHDYEEMYYLLEGDIELTVRGETVTLGKGDAVNIPANAPHAFRNTSGRPARFLCMTTTTGLEDFFRDIGTPVATRTTPAPPMGEAEVGAFMGKALEIRAQKPHGAAAAATKRIALRRIHHQWARPIREEWRPHGRPFTTGVPLAPRLQAHLEFVYHGSSQGSPPPASGRGASGPTKKTGLLRPSL